MCFFFAFLYEFCFVFFLLFLKLFYLHFSVLCYYCYYFSLFLFKNVCFALLLLMILVIFQKKKMVYKLLVMENGDHVCIFFALCFFELLKSSKGVKRIRKRIKTAKFFLAIINYHWKNAQNHSNDSFKLILMILLLLLWLLMLTTLLLLLLSSCSLSSLL